MMNTKLLFYTIALFFSCNMILAQTSYGGMIEPGSQAGLGGGGTNSYYGFFAGLGNSNEDNTFIGFFSGHQSNALGNTFLGAYSGENATTGVWNVFIGSRSGRASVANPSTGNANTFVGYNTGTDNQSGATNTFIGSNTGHSNSTGNANTFIGSQSGYFNSIGEHNVYVGHTSGYENEGSDNVFIGFQAGFSQVSTSNRLIISNFDDPSPLIWGDFSNDELRFNGSLRIRDVNQNDGLTHVLVEDAQGDIHWRDASTLDNQGLSLSDNMLNITNGTGVDISGTYAVLDSPSFVNEVTVQDFRAEVDNLYNLGSRQHRFGYLYVSKGLKMLPGSETEEPVDFLHGRNLSVALGNGALGGSAGKFNTAIGLQAMTDNDSGANNIAIGHEALRTNKTAGNNVAIGFQAMRGKDLMPTSGHSNTVIGYRSLHFNETGIGNVALGHSTLLDNENGNNNVALGREALVVNISGSENVAIGYNSGPTVGNDNLQSTVAIGTLASVGENSATAIGNGASATGINSTALGNGAIINNDNEMTLGNAAITAINAYVPGLTDISDGRFKTDIQENIPGLDFINALRPVSYQLEQAQIHKFLTGKDAPKAIDSELSIGFIAQEVEQVLKRENYVFTGLKKPKSEQDHYGLRYVEFVVPLTKAVQELSEKDKTQQQHIETLQQLVETQQQEIKTLKNMAYGAGVPETVTKSNGEDFALYQNVPNPFDKTTTISAKIPETVRQAKITIYNLNGLELQSYDLNKRGNISVEISGGVLPSGMYLYALLADGRIIDTKKMILTK